MINFNEQTKILNKAEGAISMPKKIRIGDPMYFRSGSGLEYTYSKVFRGKSNWACSIEVVESLVTCPPNQFLKETFQYKDMCFKIYLAYDEKMLSLLKEGKRYTRQKEKVTELGVDSASYILDINDNYELIRTGGDGSIGYVCEYFTKTKLEGIIIEATLPRHDGFDYIYTKRFFEKIFDCKLVDEEIK